MRAYLAHSGMVWGVQLVITSEEAARATVGFYSNKPISRQHVGECFRVLRNTHPEHTDLLAFILETNDHIMGETIEVLKNYYPTYDKIPLDKLTNIFEEVCKLS